MKHTKENRKFLFWGVVLVLLILAGCGKDAVNQRVMRNTPANSANILINRTGSTLYTANMDVNTVSLIDVQQKKVIAEIPVGREPGQIALSPDEKQLYVSYMLDNEVAVIDLEKQEVVQKIKVGIEPYGLLTSIDGAKLYVVNYRSSTVSIIDLETFEVLKSISVEQGPRGLSMTADGGKLYITHYLTGKLSIWDTKQDQVTKVVSLAPSPDQKDRKKSQGIANTLEQITLSPDGKTAWIAHLLSNIDTPIQFEETIFPAFSVIDTEKDEELKEQRKELFEEINLGDVKNETIIVSNPYDLVFSPDGTKAYAVMGGSEDLLVFDLARGGNATQILRRIPGDNPRGIAISPDGNELFIHNAMSHDLAFIQTNADDPYGEVTLDADNLKLVAKDPLPPLVRKGKTIFNSANSDEYPITGNNWMSCVSCHSDGQVNGLTFTTPKGPRNIPSNVLTTKAGLFMWDGSRDDFTDYLITVQDEMGGMMDTDPAQPLPKEQQEIYDALLAYLDDPNSFPVPKSPYHQANGSLTTKAEEGKQIFEGKAGCIQCHAGEFFTDSVKAVDGSGNLTTANTNYLYDVGTTSPLDKGTKGDARAHYKNPRKPHLFDTPTLRGVWATAPYLHDGSAATIYDVLVTRNPENKHGNVSSLSKEELDALVEYVNSIE
ncbi:beta-propeller fold lactonase family protein [Ammoniphilus resinae]|uniref:YVTN family beta-propeller protein n=1 Tax=Ammoniphilus resinae TaxID=861532 RepID=A0ABS4GUM3_9BACL|nr:beta-propeller fold lactonase family protein [Ammoniphilus resinae]MBP1933807.1 YVTN family beta-propeller protein [Ammoniphilus resinae]